MGEEKSVELYRKYRPRKLSELVGQDEAVLALSRLGKEGKIPHCLLLSGPSGVGKTTIARILRRKLGCSDLDYFEVNAASTRGIDLPREISEQMLFSPMGGKVRVWTIDECHRLTGDAQSAFLKILEDIPQHVYFFLCTTDPQKLLPTIRTRAYEIALKPIPVSALVALVKRIAEAENVQLEEEVVDRIADMADGSARKALVLLHGVLGEKDTDKQLGILAKSKAEHQSIEIARKLLDTRTRWVEMASILRGLEGTEEEAEGIRRMVISYMVKVMLSGAGSRASRAADIVDAFSRPWYESRFAGLVLSCFDLTSGKSEKFGEKCVDKEGGGK